ncbi:MAG: hypothetical protein NBV65_12760 [Burkholderiaceae bacterium]|nr:hypothetical protein [Burkholderiaceae bacterium]
MDVIRKLEDVWDNGESAPASLSCEELDHFKRITNAKRVVARRWVYRGQVHQTPFFVRLLPDESGLVQYENNDPRSRRLLVLNGDESQRLSITVPQIDGHSRPERGYLSLPPSSARFGGIEWGCEGNDGYTDYLFDFDWNTGELLRYARPTRPW